MTDLGSLAGATPGVNSSASGINTAGFVVGQSTLGDFATQHAFVWSPKSKAMTDLGTLPGGTTSSASAINTIGVIAGSSDNASGATHATLWAVSSKGVVSSFDLGTLPNGTTSNAFAINDFLAVVGSADNTTTGNTDAFVWLGKMFDLGTLGGSFAQAQSVNNLGAIVGFSNTTGDADVHAFIWTVKKGMVDLNTLIPANSGWDLQSASSINDSGKIVGSGIFIDPVNGPEMHSFILTPKS
jgi:probable HAF family extracellular repeat protein